MSRRVFLKSLTTLAVKPIHIEVAYNMTILL